MTAELETRSNPGTAAGFGKSSVFEVNDIVYLDQGKLPEHFRSDDATGALGVAMSGIEYAARSGRQVGQSVRRHPVEALLLAGAVGYLFGWAVI